MGEFKTQKRTLKKDKITSFATSATLANPIQSSQIPSASPWHDSTQQTESYRTVSRAVVEDPLSSEAINEFTDIAGNGFKGELPLSANTGDTGHEFYTTRTSWRSSHSDWKYSWLPATGSTIQHCRGPLCPVTNGARGGNGYATGEFPPMVRMSQNDINHYGSKAINNSLPTKPGFSLATFLGELTEGLPAILGLDTLKSRGERVRASGGEYLNVEFGWKPLLSDLQKAVGQLANANRIIRQFERDGGKLVHRTFRFPTIVGDTANISDMRTGSNGLYGFSTSANRSAAFSSSRDGRAPNEVIREQLSSQDIYFRGAFQYAVIEGHTFSDKLAEFEQKSQILLGTRVTPEVLWNLAPWSWLADWSFNIGDIISNSTYLSSDGLVMKYGYLMRHTMAYNRYIIPRGARFASLAAGGKGVETGPIYTVFGRETKERYKATPYGFGLNPSDFSLKQWAILGALGLTKAPKVLF